MYNTNIINWCNYSTETNPGNTGLKQYTPTIQKLVWLLLYTFYKLITKRSNYLRKIMGEVYCNTAFFE